MELQLGLALPTATNHPIKGGFDLNNQSYEQQQQIADTRRSKKCNNKRGYDDDADDDDAAALDNNTRPLKETLCLLLWKKDEDDGKNLNNNNLADSNNDSDEEEGSDVVGWPPIKTWRRKLRHPHQLQHENVLVHGNRRRQGQGQGGSNSMYVKVKMEGVGIGRKVNLGHHQSYQTLTATLIGMFGKYEETHHHHHQEGTGSLDGSRTPYVLTYQDREGDWLLVGDVPWQTFIRSVQSLKIQRRKTGNY